MKFEYELRGKINHFIFGIRSHMDMLELILQFVLNTEGLLSEG